MSSLMLVVVVVVNVVPFSGLFGCALMMMLQLRVLVHVDVADGVDRGGRGGESGYASSGVRWRCLIFHPLCSFHPAGRRCVVIECLVHVH